MDENIEVRSVAEVPWSDVVQVFGERGDSSRCWCQFFRVSNADFQAAPADELRELLRRDVASDGTPPGLIGYIDGVPVAWVAVRPRTDYPRLLRWSVVAAHGVTPVDAPDVWSVSCFVVRPGFRRRGLSSALLSAAIDAAQSHGARVVEAYPTDTSTRARWSGTDLYRGTLAVFERAGFTRVDDGGGGRAVVRLDL
jgi:GNAT superfamily N-acetyltransferase